MSLALQRLSEKEPSRGVQLFLYSENGAGKTFWNASAGDDWVFLTTGNGIATLQSKLFKERVGTNPFVLELEKDPSPTNPKAFDAARNKLDWLLAPTQKDSWKGIIIDDINDIRIGARTKAVDLNSSLSRSKTSVNAQSGKFKDIIIPTQSDFGTEMGLVETFLRELTDGLRSYDKHSIVCAHQRLYRNKGSNDIIGIKPLLTGTDTPDILPGIFDMVWYLRVAGRNREMVTEPEGTIMAKTRYGGLFKPVERITEQNPFTAKDAFGRIEAYLDKEYGPKKIPSP